MYKIEKMINDSTRYMIVLAQTNEVIANRNGYGYTTKKMANKAIKFLNQQNSFKNKELKEWWNNHLLFKDKVIHLINSGLSKKTINEEILLISNNMNIKDFKLSYLKYFKNLLKQ